MQTLLQDFRYTLRQLFKNPGFALTGILSLALGIGATTAVYSVIHAILMDPYPYAASDRMVACDTVDEFVQLTGAHLSGAASRMRYTWSNNVLPKVEQYERYT